MFGLCGSLSHAPTEQSRHLSCRLVSLTWDVGLVNECCRIPRGGRELSPHAATPYLSRSECGGVVPVATASPYLSEPLTLPHPTDPESVARALQCPCRFIAMPLGLCLPVSSLLFSQI